jgi:subtilisin family serine protease
MRVVAVAAAALALLAAAGEAEAARYAVGLRAGTSVDAVAGRLALLTGRPVDRELAPVGALLVSAPSPRGLADIPGVAYVERVDVGRRPAFATDDPLAAKQWYLSAVRAFDAWPELPALPGVKVAIIDSGIDGGHPEFEGRVSDHRSFVGGDPLTDQKGHGTFVAGIIAANANNGAGIAGMAFPAQLIVAKVVRADGSVPLEAEAKAIRWATDVGAQVINLSLGGVRDPLHPGRDTFSPLEAAAVAYAYRHGAVLVAAVGNGDQAPSQPWEFASYPAALPHVIGVSALARNGGVPDFSDRDRIFNDVAAPGEAILSTLPRLLTAEARPACPNQGYSDCGPDEFRFAEGTSFAAPQVTAAAALVLSARPELAPDQVMTLLTRTAVDLNATTGCSECPLLRDSLTGWGRLDVTAALVQAQQGELPEADRFETNDDAGEGAYRLWGQRRELRATLDFWDDQTDVYQVRLRGKQRLSASLRGLGAAKLFLWRPGTAGVDGLSLRVQRMRVAQSVQRGAAEQVAFRAPAGGGGWYYLQVKLSGAGAGAYELSVAKSSPR